MNTLAIGYQRILLSLASRAAAIAEMLTHEEGDISQDVYNALGPFCAHAVQSLEAIAPVRVERLSDLPPQSRPAGTTEADPPAVLFHAAMRELRHLLDLLDARAQAGITDVDMARVFYVANGARVWVQAEVERPTIAARTTEGGDLPSLIVGRTGIA